MTATYRVTWEVDVTADNPRDAAIKAMQYQDARTTANVFTVAEFSARSGRHLDGVQVDLGDVPRHTLPEYEGDAS